MPVQFRLRWWSTALPMARPRGARHTEAPIVGGDRVRLYCTMGTHTRTFVFSEFNVRAGLELRRPMHEYEYQRYRGPRYCVTHESVPPPARSTGRPATPPPPARPRASATPTVRCRHRAAPAAPRTIGIQLVPWLRTVTLCAQYTVQRAVHCVRAAFPCSLSPLCRLYDRTVLTW